MPHHMHGTLWKDIFVEINRPKNNKGKEAFMINKDVACFIGEEIWRKRYELDFIENYEEVFLKGIQLSMQKYNKYKFFVNVVDNIYNYVLSLFRCIPKRKNNQIVLFGSIKHSSLIKETSKHYMTKMIVRGRKDRLFAIRHFIEYVSVNNLYPFVYNYFIQRDKKFLYELIEETEKKLKIVKPDYIILLGDALPIARAIVLVSKEMGITTMEIQHGIYGSHDQLSNGRVDDYVLVWGKYFKNLYIEQGIRKPDEVYVLGYPYSIERNIENYNRKEKIVCYLGQNFEKYNKDLLKIKVDTINRLNKICINLNLGFVYRPHPGDDVKLLKNELPKVKFTPKGEKLMEAFKKYEIFISFSSSSLIEAAMRSKICIQLMNLPILRKNDNFEKLGVCTKSLGTIAEAEKYLEVITNSSDLSKFKVNFNNYYVDVSSDPKRRFFEILNEIKKVENES